MNDIDKQIVNLLSLDGRTSNAELARKIGLSAPSVAERIRRLEDIGVVAGFSLKVEPKALGFPLAAYIRIRPMPGNHRKIAALMTTLEAVIDEIIPFATTNTSILQSTAVPRRTRLLA